MYKKDLLSKVVEGRYKKRSIALREASSKYMRKCGTITKLL